MAVILPVLMHVRPTVPGAMIRFPSDPRRVVPDEGCDVPDTGDDALHFNRLIRTGELIRTDAMPTGGDPLSPLTTR